MIKKGCMFCLLCVFIIFLASFVPAEVVIEKKVVTDTVITEINEPAVFEFTIKNLGSSDNFEIYSLANVEMTPVGTFRIASGASERIIVQVYVADSIKQKLDSYIFSYKIKGQISDIQEDKLTVKISPLQDAFDISIDNINPESSSTIARVKNKLNFDFKKIDAVFTSALFSHEESFSLEPLEEKEFEIPIDKEKTKSLVAGSYSFATNLLSSSASANIKGQLKFTEKSSVISEEKTSGFIVFTKTIEKINDGNVPAIAKTTIRKDAISRLFTRFEPEPSFVQRKGFIVTYTWQKELLPGDSFEVRARTNWIFPLVLVVLIVVVVFLVTFYLKSNLLVKKSVKFVETKEGILALKVTLVVSAKKFVEKISIIDKVPALMKIYDKYSQKPERIDEKNNRVEWNIENLDTGETRIFSYIVYSKVGIVGKLELPPATAVYEKNNRILEVKSNKAFFIAEPGRIQEE